MNFDFDSRTSRLEKDQAKRREEAKKKREIELRQQAEKKRIEDELTELARRRKIEAELAEELRRAEEEAESALTGGVKYKEAFSQFFAIKDSEDDKIILPETALQELTAQEAFGRGAAVFQITLSSTSGSKTVVRVTHCGVREFSAAPGTLGLPGKIIDTLWEDSSTPLTGTITVKYIKLPKITYVKLQPKMNTFFKVEPVKLVLEENLRFHATLTVGDVVTVWYRGVSHPLRVVEMKPEDRGTLVDTDVEVDLENSEEQQTKAQVQTSAGTNAQTQQASTITSTASAVSGKRLGRADESNKEGGVATDSLYHKLPSSSSSSSSSPSTATIGTIAGAASVPSSSSSSSSLAPPRAQPEELSLPVEPEAGSANVIAVKVKTPTGSTLSRRFYTTESLTHLFRYVSAQTGLRPAELQLSTRFPPRVFSIAGLGPQSAETSFVDAGITAPQELFLAAQIST
jgi:hypothetical protein